MDETYDRAKVLPRSGLGVQGQALVIWPPGQTLVRIDARVFDRVAVEREPAIESALIGIVAALFAIAAVATRSWIGLFGALLLAAFAAQMLYSAWRARAGFSLVLARGEHETSLPVPEGRDAAHGLVNALKPLARGEVVDPVLVCGSHAAVVREKRLEIGARRFSFADVERWSRAGLNLPLEQRAEYGVVPAALAMFAIRVAGETPK